MSKSLLRIALLGTRGVPARYSGFETCAEELGVRLVERRHDVTVYCRSQFSAGAPAVSAALNTVGLLFVR